MFAHQVKKAPGGLFYALKLPADKAKKSVTKCPLGL